MDSVEKLLPERLLIHLFDREFDDVKLLRHLAARQYVIFAGTYLVSSLCMARSCRLGSTWSRSNYSNQAR